MERSYLEEKEEGSSFDIKRFLTKLLKNYPWFILLIGLFAGGAFFYLRYTQPLYQVATYIQIQQPNDAAQMLGGSPFAQTGGLKQQQFPDMNSEIFKLQSAALVGEVVDSLNLDVALMASGKVKNKPVNLDSLPVFIDVNKANEDFQSPIYKLTLNDKYFTLTSEKGSINGQYYQPLVINGDTVKIQPKDSFSVIQKRTYDLRFMSRAGTVANYVGRLAVSAVPKGGAGMLQVAVQDEIPQRARKFIDVLINRYDFSNLTYKNKALKTEMDFLDSRLTSVNSELETQENYVRDFKASNKINDVSSSANQLLSSLTNIDQKKNENEYKESLLKLVETNINTYNGQEERINAPGLTDFDLNALISNYNTLVSQKSNILVQGAPQDPRLPPLNAKLEESRKGIINRIASIRDELRANNEYLSNQEKNTTGRFQVLPEKEKDYIQVNRLLNIKQSLYVFLLQKKEDKNIEFASSGIVGSRIVDWRVSSNVQNPKPYIVYAIAIAVGLLIPTIIILIRFLLNKKIEAYQDIYKATSLPIAGEISYDGKNKEGIVITAGNRTPIAEQFRTLRTNISYISQGQPHKVLLVTSSISGEGKSFISLNLANTIAITNKKVVLLEFDLRNPGLSDKLGIDFDTTAGLSNYLADEKKLEDIIMPLNGYENLSFISCGSPLPSNPGEIILTARMQELFTYLRKNYDYIIVDTPPIEAVSDALTLGKFADISFFVIRHKYSLKSSLTLVNQLGEDQKIPHPALVINGIKPGHGFQNVYGYGYGNVGKNGRKKKNTNSNLKIA